MKEQKDKKVRIELKGIFNLIFSVYAITYDQWQ